MPLNHEAAPLPYAEQEGPENQETPANHEDARLGAKVLSMAGFQERHKPATEFSFDQARNKGEKLFGNNAERRNYAYLSRLERLINERGNKLEQKLWRASNKNLLVEYDDIPESYWDSKRQELRDNGYGDIELTEQYKHEVFQEERKLQAESLEKWVNYLGDEESPYPLWFKIYVWDGMTKMGKYNKAKGRYETRNKSTVSPYPNPDAEILASTFDVINRYYGNNEKEFYTKEGERNIPLENIVQSGNFPKIYNAIQQDMAPILTPPEKAEDVHGQWVEYAAGEEEDIARAARGTGWCIASPGVGKHYLKYGTYGESEFGAPEDDGNQARFILFHLEDAGTGRLTKNACASIRLGPDGRVAEISGLEDGQALNDSLIPTVEEKVRSLPGGEEFLPKFADKNELIRLDRKMQNNENLTTEELRFIYELDRPIATLDTYHDSDPRIRELRNKYNYNYALQAGIDVNELVSKMRPHYIANNLDILIQHGADVNELVSKMDPNNIANNLDTLIQHGAEIDVNELVGKMDPFDIVGHNLNILIQHGADVNKLVSKAPPYIIADNLDTLIQHGADINELVSKMRPHNIADNLDPLIQHGAEIDVNELVSKMAPEDIANNLDTLIQHGAEINANELVSKMDSRSIDGRNFDALLEHGADVNELVSKMSPNNIANNLDTLIRHGAEIDVNELVGKMSLRDIANNLDTLIRHGAEIDVNELVGKRAPYIIITNNLDTLVQHGAEIDVNDLVSKISPNDIANNLDTLIQHGAEIDVNELVDRMEPYDIAYNLDTLIRHGAEIDVGELVSKMEPRSVDGRNFNALLKHGADVNELVSKAPPYFIANNLDALIQHGADVNELVSKMRPHYIANNLDILIQHGADVNELVSKMDPYYIVNNLNILIQHGAEIDVNELVSKIRPYFILNNLDTLIQHGADANELISKMRRLKA